MRRPLLAALIWITAAGCGAPPAPQPAGPPARIVSLAPSITEIVFALGAGEKLVGACAQCNYPDAATRIPRVGGYLVPSVEAVLGARPDLVIAVPSPGNREAVQAVERTGVRVLVVHDRTLADLWETIRSIAATLDVAARGEELVADVSKRLDGVHAQVAGLPVRRVLLVIDHHPLVVTGGGNLQDELVGMAGGVNVAADAGAVWPTLALETVVARAPDVIIDAAMGTEEGGRDLFAGLTTVPAVRDNRIVSLRADVLFRSGPRVPEAAAALAAAIHPEAFAAPAG